MPAATSPAATTALVRSNSGGGGGGGTGGARIRKRSRTKNQHTKLQKQRKLSAGSVASAAAADLASVPAVAGAGVGASLPIDCIRSILSFCEYPFAISVLSVCRSWSHAMDSINTRRAMLQTAIRMKQRSAISTAMTDAANDMFFDDEGGEAAPAPTKTELQWSIHSLDSVYIGMMNYRWIVRQHMIWRYTYALLSEAIVQTTFMDQLNQFLFDVDGLDPTPPPPAANARATTPATSESRLSICQSACGLHASLILGLLAWTPNKTLYVSASPLFLSSQSAYCFVY